MIEQDLLNHKIYFTGGNIAIGCGDVSFRDGRNGVFVQFQSLELPAEVGASVAKAGKVSPQVSMVFMKPESIDVVIKQLKESKKKLQNLTKPNPKKGDGK